MSRRKLPSSGEDLRLGLPIIDMFCWMVALGVPSFNVSADGDTASWLDSLEAEWRGLPEDSEESFRSLLSKRSMGRQ